MVSVRLFLFVFSGRRFRIKTAWKLETLKTLKMLEYKIKLSLIFLNWGEVFLDPDHALKVIFSVSGPFLICLVPHTKKNS